MQKWFSDTESLLKGNYTIMVDKLNWVDMVNVVYRSHGYATTIANMTDYINNYLLIIPSPTQQQEGYARYVSLSGLGIIAMHICMEEILINCL